ncbi:MAG: malate dehydrogenase [Anaerolineae bacterium CG2_30_64_16]|nr:MAG: malate dehydrogenase [Anaerolineae bacterium CG2_30_64_16]
MSKVSIIGAGFVGSTIAHWALISGGCQVVLVDVVEGLARGKVLDLMQSGPIAGHSVDAIGTSDMAETANSDIVVVTAGVARKPGMSREDLVQVNAGIVGGVVEQIVKLSPNAILLMMTNPLDTMTYLALKKSGFPRARVIGQAGVLDSGRMRAFIALETGISPENIHTTVLGGHGDEMVPLVRYSNIAGVPLAYFLTDEQIAQIVARTRDAGAEIVRYLKTGSAYYAPGAAACRMAQAIIKNTHEIYPAAVYLQGEYGLRDICFGVPVILGKNGVERIIELDLNEAERAALMRSADSIRSTMAHLRY